MKYLSLRLSGYKRLMYNNIESFTFEPTEPIQLILGTNGSGKSSLLQELSPLPANPNDYNEGGSKYISVEHNNYMYDLSSVFGSKHPHSFVKGNVEMNPGGTVSVQKELVRQEFGITPVIHELMISQSSLSNMKSPERRYWFTRLSDTNYDYAIAVYKRLSEKSRDVAGALKLSKKRLVTEMSKIATEQEQVAIRLEVEKLHDLLQHLIEYRKPLPKTLPEYERQTQLLKDKIVSTYNLLQAKLNTCLVRDKTIEQVDAKLVQLQMEHGLTTMLNNACFAEHSEMQEVISAAKATGGQGIANFRLQAEEYIKAITGLRAQNKLMLVVTDPVNAKKALEAVYDTLSTVFASLPINIDKKYSRNTLNEAIDKVATLKYSLELNVKELSKLEAIKLHQEHQRDNDKTKCPNCDHVWSKGYDEDYYNKIVLSIDNNQEAIDELTIKLVETKQLVEDVTEYANGYKQFLSCINNFPILSSLWNHLLKDDLVARSPSSVLTVLHTFQGDLEVDIQIAELNTQLSKTNEMIELSKKTEEVDLGKLQAKVVAIEDKVAGFTEKFSDIQTESKKLQNYKKDIQEILSLAETIELMGLSLTNMCHEYYEAFRISALQEAIRSVQITLANKEKILSEINAHVSVIKDIEKQIAQQELEDTAYKAVLKELSPTDGLIAQGLMGFINSFVNQMNMFIKKIWLYPLKVTACGMDNEGELELDYKFPLLVQDTNEVEDVSKGSSAMKEVVDLAFKLTAMKYLDLSTAPLFLDEFAKALDSAHRVTAIEAVKSLMDDTSFSQLYMISHYENSYSALTNAQICVICPDNIVIPKNAVVNEHVTMS